MVSQSAAGVSFILSQSEDLASLLGAGSNAVAQGVDESLQLIVSRRFDAMETLLAVVILGIDAIEKQHRTG